VRNEEASDQRERTESSSATSLACCPRCAKKLAEPRFSSATSCVERPGSKASCSSRKEAYVLGQDIVVAAFRQLVAAHPEALLVTSWHNYWPATMEPRLLTGYQSIAWIRGAMNTAEGSGRRSS